VWQSVQTKSSGKGKLASRPTDPSTTTQWQMMQQQMMQQHNAWLHCPHMPHHRPNNGTTTQPMHPHLLTCLPAMMREGLATRTPPWTSTHYHHCEQLLAGWMGGANGWGHQGTWHRANDRHDDMDTKGMTGSGSKGGMNQRGNEQMTIAAPAHEREWGGEEHEGVFLFLSFSWPLPHIVWWRLVSSIKNCVIIALFKCKKSL